MALTKAQMRTLIQDDIIDRDDKSTLVSYSLDWGLEYIDKSGTFADLMKEEITLTTVSCTFESATDVAIGTDIITTSIDIPTGTKITFTVGTDTGDALPTGLSASTDYWAIRGSSTAITVASTYKNAWIGTVVDITATGTGTHTLTAYRERLAKPSSCKYIYDIRLIDGAMSRKLEPVTPRRADLYEPFGQQLNVGRPSQYCEWLDWIQLSKIPDDTYVVKIRYIKWQDAFATDSSTAEISHADDLIIKAASMHIWELLGEPEQATIMRNSLEIGLHKHKQFVERMKPDLVLKPNMGSVAVSNSESQSDPFISSQG